MTTPASSFSLEQTRPVDPNSARLVGLLDALYPAVVSDVLDKKGLPFQVLAPSIRPIAPGMKLAGLARTLQVQPAEGSPPAGEEYKVLFECIDSLQSGDIIVTSAVDSCIWGELMSEAALQRGGRGIVSEGYLRDAEGVLALGFPSYFRGYLCSDVLGRAEAVARDVPVSCGGVTVHPGDYLIGNIDGVVVIPAAVAEEVIEAAAAKASDESMVRAKLREGLSVTEAWRRYGVM